MGYFSFLEGMYVYNLIKYIYIYVFGVDEISALLVRVFLVVLWLVF